MSDQIVLALIAGVMTPLQAAVNARLGRLLGSRFGRRQCPARF
jgi:uncharacterized membrane protein YdcZ (DUF606 family)